MLYEVITLDLIRRRRVADVPAAIALRGVEDAARYGRTVLREGKVASFSEKSGTGRGLVSGGVYALCRETLIV